MSLPIKDSSNATRNLKTTTVGGDDVPHHIVSPAPNLVCSTANASTSAATLVGARATRKSVTIRNNDASILVYVGPATVSSTNGYGLGPGASVTLTYTGLIQVIAVSGTPSVSAADEYY